LPVAVEAQVGIGLCVEDGAETFSTQSAGPVYFAAFQPADVGFVEPVHFHVGVPLPGVHRLSQFLSRHRVARSCR